MDTSTSIKRRAFATAIFHRFPLGNSNAKPQPMIVRGIPNKGHATM